MRELLDHIAEILAEEWYGPPGKKDDELLPVKRKELAVAERHVRKLIELIAAGRRHDGIADALVEAERRVEELRAELAGREVRR